MKLEIFDSRQFVGSAQTLLHPLQKRLALSERSGVGLRGLRLGFGNGQIDGFHLHAKACQRRAEVFGIAHRYVAQILRLKMLLGHTKNVGLGHGSNRLLVLEDEILRITVILVNHQPVDGFAGTVEIKDEAIEHRVLGGLQFLVGHLGGSNFFQLIANRL